MDTPKLVPCRATWIRGREVEWWDWGYDEEKKAYIRHDEMVSPATLLRLTMEMQAEGWQLCRAVV